MTIKIQKNVFGDPRDSLLANSICLRPSGSSCDYQNHPVTIRIHKNVSHDPQDSPIDIRIFLGPPDSSYD